MELSELNVTEQLVLVGLAKAIVHADQEVSREETEAIRGLAEAVGTDAWNARVAEARVELATAEQLFALAKSIQRIEARECIHQALRRLAESDQMAETEQEILTWVAEVWQLGGLAVDHTEEDVEDDDTYEDEFVLFEVEDD